MVNFSCEPWFFGFQSLLWSCSQNYLRSVHYPRVVMFERGHDNDKDNDWCVRSCTNVIGPERVGGKQRLSTTTTLFLLHAKRTLKVPFNAPGDTRRQFRNKILQPSQDICGFQKIERKYFRGHMALFYAPLSFEGRLITRAASGLPAFLWLD